MSEGVYKSRQGQKVVESFYRQILTAHSSSAFTQLFIQTEIARTHVLRFGETGKPPLVMLHGSAANSAVWLGNIADFIDHFCIYCVDIPGEPGLSEPIRCSLKTDAPYRWLASLLDHLAIDKSSFATMSLGSWYGLNFAIRSSERVKALSMMTTPGIVPAKAGFILKALVFAMLGSAGQRLLSKTIYHKTKVPPQVLEFQGIVSKHFHPVLETIPIFTDTELAKITIPVQFFGGDHDALINSVKTGARLKRLLPHSEIHILQDTGHAIIDQFSAVKDFLLSH
ncbi:alpha/beta hydrolase [candidate division KSB1 bacterium]|nr:alpha/beta hydrolase [candidate division KSB1 bacterium]